MKQYIQKLRTIVIVGLALLPLAVFAVGTSEGGIPNPLGDKVDSFTGLVATLLQKVVLPIGTTIVVFFIIYSGFLFVTAQGNEEKLTKAKTAIIWTIVGAAVLLGATIFSTLICETVKDLGVPIECSVPKT